MERLATYTIEEVHPYVLMTGVKIRSCLPVYRRTYGGYQINMTSLRLQTFRLNLRCVTCGVRGSFFALERSKGGSVHLNLYAIGGDGNERLMTRDHIKPKSKGGEEHLSNMQTMCSPCNQAKGDTYVPKGAKK